MNRHNEMELSFLSVPENEAFARVVIAAFTVQLSPTMSDIADVKTAVSEAVTNAIIHGYEGTRGMVTRDRKCGTGYGALLYHPPRTGTQRHGLCRHADLHGRGGCPILPWQRHIRIPAQTHPQCERKLTSR